MNPNMHHKIREARERLALTDGELASRVGLLISAYDDIEQHADELRSSVELGTVRRICDVLELDLFELVGLPTDVPPTASETRARNELIRSRMRDLKISTKQLAWQLGFDEVAITEMLEDSDFLETWPLELIASLATHLDIPLHALLMRGNTT